ncbi:MAG: site-specific integrase [Thermodesulfobacteriota bacterium]
MRGSVGYDRARRTWWYRHDLPRGAEGRRRTTGGRGYPTKRAAEDALAFSLWQSRQAGGPPPSELTVAGYLSRAVEARAAALAPGTLQRYRRTLQSLVEPDPLGRVALAALGPGDVAAWIEHLSRRLAPITVASTWRVVETHLRPLAESLPAGTLAPQLPRVPRPPLRVWSPEHTRRVLLGLRGDLLHTPLLVAVTTGLRAGELLALEWGDLQGDALVIQKSVSWIGGGPLLKETKTKEHRRVELYPEALAALEEHRAAQRTRRLLLPEWDCGERIFPRWSGGWWCPQNLSTQFGVRLKRLPVPRIRWHDLRHTHASHLLAAGVPVPTVSARLGHANVATTLRIYAHLVPGQQREAVRLGAPFLALDRGETCNIGTHRYARTQKSREESTNG